MRTFTRHNSAVTLTELMAAAAICAVVSMVAWATVEMGRRETYVCRLRADTNRTAFNTLQSIQTEIMRAKSIEVPDPYYPHYDSIQLTIPTDTGDVRRCFRLEAGQLVADFRDEGGPFEAYSGISELTFDILDEPVNTIVEVTCQSATNGETVAMRLPLGSW